jgi:hypothetical protein
MRRLLLMLPLLFLATPAFAWDWFSWYNDYDRQGDCQTPPAVPEPTAALLFAAGAGLVGWRMGRRQR